MRTKRASVALTFATAILLVAPGAIDAIQDTQEPQVIHVVATDFDFAIDQTIISAGRVQFEVSNSSDELKHELWIYPIEERESPGFQEMLVLKRTGQRADESEFIDGIVGKSGEVAAGTSATFTVDFFPPGVYEFSCFTREGTGDIRQVHYDEGMFSAVVVVAATTL